MAFGIRITEVEQISSLDGVDDIYVRKDNNFYRMDANAFIAEMKAQTYTTLTRNKQTVTVHFHGLRADKTYKLCLYTASRHRGNKMGAWYHPDNYNVEPVDGKSDHRMGYGKLAGKTINKSKGSVFPEVPSWMRGGEFLRTEWNVSLVNPDVYIDLSEWLIPMVKPAGLTKWTTESISGIGSVVVGRMIGVSNNHLAGLLFRFCLVDGDGTVYPCINTLTVGCGRWNDKYNNVFPRVFVDGGDISLLSKYLYTSIR